MVTIICCKDCPNRRRVYDGMGRCVYDCHSDCKPFRHQQQRTQLEKAFQREKRATAQSIEYHSKDQEAVVSLLRKRRTP